MTVLPASAFGGGVVRPVATAADIVSAHKAVTQLIQEALVEGEDYGVIPGTKRPTLLKPGAERLTIAFGAHAEFEILQQEVEHDRVVKWTKRTWEWGQKRGEKVWSTTAGESVGLYRYVTKCRLVRPDGQVIGEGMGTCSSLEAKYVDRPRECENTILKMSKKRAHVDATLSMAGLSDRFSQDAEEAAVMDSPPVAASPAGSAHPPARTPPAGYSSGPGAAPASHPGETGKPKPDQTGGKPSAGKNADGGGQLSTQHDPVTGEVRPSERSQHVRIFAKCGELGHKDKDASYLVIEKIVGHELIAADGKKSIKVLTFEEADRVYAELSKMAGPPDPTDADAPPDRAA